jgi:NADH:ubiquinone oxidoreductase subunit 3 (subunit A)
MIENFLYPIAAFLIILVIVYLGYLITGSWGPKYKKEKYKKQSYACGEDYPGGKLHHSYNFFHIAFFFTVLHVGALLITTAPAGSAALLGLVLIGAMGLTAFALFVGGGDHHD